MKLYKGKNASLCAIIDHKWKNHNLKIRILDQKYNPLLKRKEVVFEVDHSQEGQTTPRIEIRKNLANILKTKFDLVIVEKFETKTGTMIAIGEANAYETTEQAKLVERKHIITRNTPPEKPSAPEKMPQKEPEEKQPIETREPEKQVEPQEKVEEETQAKAAIEQKPTQETEMKEGEKKEE